MLKRVSGMWELNGSSCVWEGRGGRKRESEGIRTCRKCLIQMCKSLNCFFFFKYIVLQNLTQFQKTVEIAGTSAQKLIHGSEPLAESYSGT